MTPLDRAALAAALQDATPETLREDAAFIVNAQTLLGNNDERFARIAALALAVAEMQEETDFIVEKCGAVVYLDMASKPNHYYNTDTRRAPATLPAALAALLKGDQ